MGQIFYASVYDTENKKCFIMEADKFHANCYSYSDAVKSVHCLLRKRAYNVMWGGGDISDYLHYINNNESLLGISTYYDFNDYVEENDGSYNEDYYNKAKFINEHSKLWDDTFIRNNTVMKFNGDIQYNGFLINHTKKLAIDLADFYEQSKSVVKCRDGLFEMAIDCIPVLTETGGGTWLALFDGISADTTDKLSTKWCGDLLQITDDLPHGYTLINCCFADVFYRAEYCRQTFGLNEEGFILCSADGKLYEAVRYGISAKKIRVLYNIKFTENDKEPCNDRMLYELHGIRAKRIGENTYTPIPLLPLEPIYF